ncbi:Phosphatase/phosphohexomutase family protein [Roseomonas mucosa]|uniref:HAD family hydrolase n=1 Tax=Roseomonas TaxID=125216 RepID=UPI00096441A9|nr:MULTISPECIES: HAD family phosphatase [Roseomonas]ATR22054.1 HAD family phosphatase [Roseomonas sp. FDAARGOS_362]QDJ08076.1 Phosphatase/phosphohexomutase family protein [Roseomonas mucosa]UZO95450.1 Phosphatase/phosphohexomutase family protein [Roseomonas mucosa]GAV34350.1 6-phosphogluconate phosphatase [Roseomonas sp. TAS13]
MRGFKAVLFDCDGVLADSEHLVDRVLAEDLTARGWALTPEESGAVFLGMALPDMAPVVKAKLGHLPPDWTEQLKRKVTETMAREVPPVPGAEALLQRLRRSPLPLALASNSSRLELSAKLGRLGFAPYFGDRIFSFEDVARPKPHPDIYLAAAAACGAAPGDCAVVEDSPTGARAGVAAGCRVLGFCRRTEPEALRAVGVSALFGDLSELPGLLGLDEEAA